MKQIIIVMFVIVLMGCGNMTGKTLFNEQIKMMETKFNEEDWTQLQSKADHLKKLYKEQQWKLQLLGDEGEYEDLNISINRLLIAIEEEDKTEAKLEMTTIQSLIDDIYSL